MAKGRRRRRKIEFNGETYNLAVIGKGVDITDQEKIEIAKVVCLMYETDKFSLQDCLGHCGIKSDSTWYLWIRKIKEIESLFLESQKIKDLAYRHNLRERARTMAERLVEGYTVQVIEREGTPGRDKEGNATIVTTRTKSKELYVKPSAAVIRMVLLNMDPHNFESNPKPVDKINKDVNIPIIEWVTNNDNDGGQDQ